MGVDYFYCAWCTQTLCSCGVGSLECVCGDAICDDCMADIFPDRAAWRGEGEETIPGCKRCHKIKMQKAIKQALMIAQPIALANPRNRWARELVALLEPFYESSDEEEEEEEDEKKQEESLMQLVASLAGAESSDDEEEEKDEEPKAGSKRSRSEDAPAEGKAPTEERPAKRGRSGDGAASPAEAMDV